MIKRFTFKDKLFYGWVVVVTFFVAGTMLLGIRHSFGVFFKSLQDEFNLTRTTTSLLVSAHMGLGIIVAFLGGWFLDWYGPRIIVLLMALFTGLSLLLISQVNSLWQLFTTYSLLLSIGTGAIFVVTVSTVSKWFDKKRGLALGIASLGTGLGTAIIAPFANYLVSNFNWRTAYLVLGVIVSLIVIPLSQLLKKGPSEIGALPDGITSESTDKAEPKPNIGKNSRPVIVLSVAQILRTRSMWLAIFINTLMAFTISLALTHIVPHVTDIGFSAGEAAVILTLRGVASAVGMVLMGNISDRVGRKKIAIVCSLFNAGAMVWLIWAQNLWILYLFALVYGFTTGGLIPTVTAIIGDTLGLHRIGVIFGVLDVGFGIGAALGPVIGGLMFDINSSYSMAFLAGALAMFVVPLLIVLIRRENGPNLPNRWRYMCKISPYGM